MATGKQQAAEQAELIETPAGVDDPIQRPLPLASTTRERELVAAGASIAEQPNPDEIEFLHATFAQVGLPRSKTTERIFERRCGHASIRIEAGSLWNGKDWAEQPLPYGTKPRLLNIYITTYAVKHKTRLIPLGESKTEAMRILGFRSASGGRNGSMTGFDQQMRAFAAMRLQLGIGSSKSARTLSAQPIKDFQAWAVPEGAQRALWPGALELDQGYFESMREFAFPLDPRAIDALDQSSLALDLYAYLAHRLCRLDKQLLLFWHQLRDQFGAQDQNTKTFKRSLSDALRAVLTVYPDAKVEVIPGGFLMKPSKPPIPKTMIAIPGGLAPKMILPPE